jgi:hypothetical protein
VREAVVLSVLYRQYADMCRGADERVDMLASKSQAYKQELDDLLARIVVHWVSDAGIRSPTQVTSRLSTRISR